MSKIISLLEKHQRVRSQAINLNVSENRLSSTALNVLSSEIQSRYHADFYSGTTPAQELIATVTKLASSLFKSKYTTVAPLSGNMCVLAVLLGLTKPQETIARLPIFPGGGYPFNYQGINRRTLDLPFNTGSWQINLEKTLEMLSKDKPELIMLGASLIVYPVPIKEIAELVHSYGGLVAYDGSHVLGLLAGQQFQDPLREGADLLFGSTHKTFPGPQG